MPFRIPGKKVVEKNMKRTQFGRVQPLSCRETCPCPPGKKGVKSGLEPRGPLDEKKRGKLKEQGGGDLCPEFGKGGKTGKGFFPKSRPRMMRKREFGARSSSAGGGEFLQGTIKKDVAKSGITLGS